jgi:hypothetical protein
MLFLTLHYEAESLSSACDLIDPRFEGRRHREAVHRNVIRQVSPVVESLCYKARGLID